MTALHDPPVSPPPGWQFQVPQYRASRDIEPAEKVRFRYEPPFSRMADNNIWQYAHKSVERGEVIATRFWPHESFIPLNYSAARVLEFFNTRQKSRLPWRPWQFDRVRLDDGLTGSMQPRISINSGVTAANE